MAAEDPKAQAAQGGDASPEASQTPSAPPLPPSSATVGQQAMVIFLIVAVGALFGMGPVLALLQGPGPQVLLSGVSEDEARMHRSIAERLQSAINPLPSATGQGPYFVQTGFGANNSRFINDSPLAYAREIWLARAAEREGLMPKGDTLEAVVMKALSTPLPRDPSRTWASALVELKGSRAVTRRQLADFLQIQSAAQALQLRATLPPPVPRTVAKDLSRLYSMFPDQVKTRSVRLGVGPLLAAHRDTVAADEMQIEQTWRSQSSTRFRVPATRTVLLVAADPRAVAKAVVISQEAIADQYDAVKEDRFLLPSPAPAEGEAATPSYRPLVEVADELRNELALAAAQPLADQLMQSYQAAVVAADLAAGGMGSRFPRDELVRLAATIQIESSEAVPLSEPVGLIVHEGLVVPEPGADGLSVVEGFSPLRPDASLFSNQVEVGRFYLQRSHVPSVEGLQFLLRVDAIAAAGTKTLDDPGVREEIIDWLAGRAAYGELLAQARAIAEAVRANGAGALERFFDEEKRAYWGVTEVESDEIAPLTALPVAPETVDGDSSEELLAISLAANNGVAVLSAAPDANGLPGLLLLQVDEYQEGALPENLAMFAEREIPRFVDGYRSSIGRLLASSFEQELQRQQREGR